MVSTRCSTTSLGEGTDWHDPKRATLGYFENGLRSLFFGHAVTFMTMVPGCLGQLGLLAPCMLFHGAGRHRRFCKEGSFLLAWLFSLQATQVLDGITPQGGFCLELFEVLTA